MNRTLLIIPPGDFLMDQKVFPYLGILVIAKILKDRGEYVEVLDMSNQKDLTVPRGFTHYGITCLTPNMPRIKKICQNIKDNGGIIILGGPHITVTGMANSDRSKKDWDEILKISDIQVIGTGIPDLNKKGVVYSDGPLTGDHIPSRELIKLEDYHYEIDGKKATSIIAQSGCPYNCGFCSGRGTKTYKSATRRSIYSILEEIKGLENLGYRGIMCYDDITEILTENRGFIKFDALGATDKVAILNPHTGIMSFEVPKKIIRAPFEGDLITVNNRLIDMAVTPDHRMWARQEKEGQYRHIIAKDLIKSDNPVSMLQRAKWLGKNKKVFKIPAYNTKYYGRGKGGIKIQNGKRIFPAIPWIKFMAWYLAEGSCYRSKIQNGGSGYRICISQNKKANPEKVKEIDAVLNDLEIKHSYSSNQFHIDSKELYEYLKQFGTSYHKFVPKEFKQMSSNLILIFLKTYIKGDGHTSPTGQETITSFSEKMRSDIQEMAIKSGYWAADKNKQKRVQLSKQRDVTINSKWGNKNNFKRMPYNGYIHCVTVSTGIILVRRNGLAVWSGNCYDDEINVNKKAFNGLLMALIDHQEKTGIELSLRGFSRADLLTPDEANLMYKAGFRWLLVGFESGSNEMLKSMNKGVSVEQNTKAIEIARAAGLKIKALLSIGHAGESLSTINETKEWVQKVKPDDFDLTIVSVYPGTPYYEKAVDKGGVWVYTSPNGGKLYSHNIDFMSEESNYKGKPGEYNCHVWTDDLSSKDLIEIRDRLEGELRTI